MNDKADLMLATVLIVVAFFAVKSCSGPNKIADAYEDMVVNCLDKTVETTKDSVNNTLTITCKTRDLQP